MRGADLPRGILDIIDAWTKASALLSARAAAQSWKNWAVSASLGGGRKAFAFLKGAAPVPQWASAPLNEALRDAVAPWAKLLHARQDELPKRAGVLAAVMRLSAAPAHRFATGHLQESHTKSRTCSHWRRGRSSPHKHNHSEAPENLKIAARGLCGDAAHHRR